MISARTETITEKRSYRRLVESKRCLIPANGFYEWRREGSCRTDESPRFQGPVDQPQAIVLLTSSFAAQQGLLS
jgi:hypothetical protein